jgi:hypothetical protein
MTTSPARIELLACIIDDAARRSAFPTVVALGCGLADEVDASLVAEDEELLWFGLDEDRTAVDALDVCWASRPNLVPVPARLGSVLAGDAAIPEADLVYAGTLAEALGDDDLRALLRVAVASTKPGGCVVIAVQDARDEEELLALAEGLPGEPRAWRDETGTVRVLEIAKPG